jgi:hypothetical protein
LILTQSLLSATDYSHSLLSCAPGIGAYFLSVRGHPKNPWIRNGACALILIFLTWHRLSVFSRLFMRFLGCDIAAALPKLEKPGLYALGKKP